MTATKNIHITFS